MYEEPIPADLNGQDVLLRVGPVGLSIEQLGLLLISLVLWIGAARYMIAGIFGVHFALALVSMSAIPAAGIAFAFKRVGNKPLDVYIGERVAFEFGVRVFVAGWNNKSSTSFEADLSRDEFSEQIRSRLRK